MLKASSMLVSVVIPMFNAQSTIERSIKSVTNQVHRRIELIVVDDFSTDHSVSAAKSAMKRYCNGVDYTLIKLVDNSGPAHARNVGVSKCSGDFIAFLDADDYWLHTKISSDLAVFSTHENCKILCSKSSYGPNQDIVPDLALADINFTYVIFRRLLFHNMVQTRTVIFRKELNVNFNSKLRRCEDYDAWLRLAFSLKNGEFLFYDRVTCIAGRPEASVGGLSGSLFLMELAELRVLFSLAFKKMIPGPFLFPIILYSLLKFSRRCFKKVVS